MTDIKDLWDRIRRIDERDKKSVMQRPAILLDVWQRWVGGYLLGSEEAEVKAICGHIAAYEADSPEYSILLQRFEEIYDDCETRAINAPVEDWPPAARQGEAEWRAWLAYRTLHPVEFVDPDIPPAPNCIHVTYFAGFTPDTLIIKPGTVVTWINKETITGLHGHFVRHVPSQGEPRLFDSTNESSWPEIGTGGSWSFKFDVPCGKYEYRCTHTKSRCGALGGTVFVTLRPDIAEQELRQQRKLHPLPPDEAIRIMNSLAA